MNDTIGLPEAAARLGVSLRILRRAIRSGRLPAPPHLSATSALSPEWFADAQAAADGSAKIFTATLPQKTPAFARFEGTSAWQKYRHRARAYARFRATASGQC